MTASCDIVSIRLEIRLDMFEHICIGKW
jgi:hypothetical protein